MLVPLMITRLILSLKKVANPQDSIWSLSGAGQRETIRFARYTISGAEGGGGDIALGRPSVNVRITYSRGYSTLSSNKHR